MTEGLLPDPEPWGTGIEDDPSWTAADDEALWQAWDATPREWLAEDPESLSAFEAIDYLEALQAQQAKLASLEVRAMAVAAGRFVDERVIELPADDGGAERRIVLRDMAMDELAAALRRSTGVVYDEIVTARLLIGPLPETFAALTTGRITARHARAIADQARRFDGYRVAVHHDPSRDTEAQAAERVRFHAACGELERRVLRVAEESTPGRTASAARRAVAAIDAEGEARRRQQARARIDVDIWPEEDGLAVILARLPMEQAAMVHAALDAQGRMLAQTHGITVGEGRVQAFVDAICHPSSAPQGSGVGVEIQVVIDAAALLGASDSPGALTVGTSGSQPITAQAVRDLVADPSTPVSLRRLVTDPMTGHLLDRGRRSYEVTGPLRAYLVARDRTCRFPGCSRRATTCQVDHAVPWDSGGASDRCNLGHLCVRHHHLKTFGGWEITSSRSDGSCSWRSPQGREYDVDPPPF